MRHDARVQPTAGVRERKRVIDQVSGPRWIGIDVAKATLEIAILPERQTFRVSNEATGWRHLGERGDLATVQGIVLEATGSDHRGVTLALAAAGQPRP